jgi:hypothetical protein
MRNAYSDRNHDLSIDLRGKPTEIYVLKISHPKRQIKPKFAIYKYVLIKISHIKKINFPLFKHQDMKTSRSGRFTLPGTHRVGLEAVTKRYNLVAVRIEPKPSSP